MLFSVEADSVDIDEDEALVATEDAGGGAAADAGLPDPDAGLFADAAAVSGAEAEEAGDAYGVCVYRAGATLEIDMMECSQGKSVFDWRTHDANGKTVRLKN